MIGHRISYLGRRIQRVWWPRRDSFDNVAVRGGVTVRDFIVIRWINNEFGSDSVSIHLQKWIDSMRIKCASPKTGFKCERDECTFDAHWIRFLGLVWKGLKRNGARTSRVNLHGLAFLQRLRDYAWWANLHTIYPNVCIVTTLVITIANMFHMVNESENLQCFQVKEATQGSHISTPIILSKIGTCCTFVLSCT